MDKKQKKSIAAITIKLLLIVLAILALTFLRW